MISAAKGAFVHAARTSSEGIRITRMDARRSSFMSARRGISRGLHQLLVASGTPSLTLALVIIGAACEGCELHPEATPTEAMGPAIEGTIAWLPSAPGRWYGLEPGRSSRSEAERILRSLEFISPEAFSEASTYWEQDVTASILSFRCIADSESHRCGSLWFVEDTLVAVSLYPIDQLTFAQAVAALGDPDGVLVDRAGGDPDECVLSLTWLRLGVTVSGGPSFSSVCSSVLEGRGPDAHERVVGITYGTAEETAAILQSRAVPWGGFARP